MQEARTLVPSFGNWDVGAEIPYTTVFEKVRATKDGKPLNSRELDKPPQTPSRHRFEGNPSMIHPQYESDKFSNASSELHRGKRSVLDEWGIQRKGSDVQSSSSRRSSLEQIADHIFAESQHAAGNESPVISRRSTSSNASWQINKIVGSRESREQQYVKENLYNQPITGGPSTVYHHQVIGSRMSGPVASPRREQLFPNVSNGSHSSYPMSAMQLHQQPLQANHRSAEMSPNKVLPKFGDWDAIDPAGVEFTVIFDKARNERKSSKTHDSSLRSKAMNVGVDEDLYKPSSTRRSGFWTLFCCSHPSVS
eukprot:c19138_g1_i1 orf=147-1073(+)